MCIIAFSALRLHPTGASVHSSGCTLHTVLYSLLVVPFTSCTSFLLLQESGNSQVESSDVLTMSLFNGRRLRMAYSKGTKHELMHDVPEVQHLLKHGSLFQLSARDEFVCCRCMKVDTGQKELRTGASHYSLVTSHYSLLTICLGATTCFKYCSAYCTTTTTC